MKLLQLLLEALLPLLTRRALAAERQAAATEQLHSLVERWLVYSDPQFLDVLRGHVPDEVVLGGPSVEADHGAARDLKALRLEQLQEMWRAQYGETLDDERLIAEYERLYEDSEARLDADKDGEVVVPSRVGSEGVY